MNIKTANRLSKKTFKFKITHFYEDWKFWAFIIGMIINTIVAANAIFLYKINKKMSAIQEATMLPQLFVQISKLSPYGKILNAESHTFQIDSVLIDYSIENNGNNTALQIISTKPVISREKSFILNSEYLAGNTVYGCLAAGQDSERMIKAIFNGHEDFSSVKADVLYVHYYIEYVDILGYEHSSYFIQSFTILSLAGNTLIVQRGDENQYIR